MQFTTIGKSLAILSLALIACGTPTQADTLLLEDFESYVSGSNLVGQGGWVEGETNSVITIANGTFLPSLVVDGRALTGQGQQNSVERSLSRALDPSATTTLLYEAYAPSVGPIAHNSLIYFDMFGPGVAALSAGWFPQAFVGFRPGWMFTVAGNTFFVTGGYDRRVEMGVVVDGSANEIYGLYDFGSGSLVTPRYSVSDADIAAITGLYLYVDHRGPGYSGMEIDNIRVFDSRVSVVPELSGLWWLGSGLAGVLWLRRNSRKR